MMDLLTILANEFEIPIIYSGQKVWFFRTKSGEFYSDFYRNKFIALGWDLISPDLIKGVSGINKEIVKTQIAKIYPDEKRPGLILSQMDVFYNKMKLGDLIVIPSEGCKEIAIGQVGELVESVIREETEVEDYPQCTYVHKRNVEWLKVVYAWQDVYLFKSLRAHQTISDITIDSKLVFRNFQPIYISGEFIHFTLQKPTTDELSVSDNIDLLNSILNIADNISALYKKESFRNEIKLKTAVGSPGFFELILPGLPTAIFTLAVVKWFLGKEISADGNVSNGVLALITKINELVNDYHNRENIDAQTAKIYAEIDALNAQTEKTYVEKELLKSQIAKTNAEARRLELENSQIEWLTSGKTTEDLRKENENIVVSEQQNLEKSINAIVADGTKMCEAAENTGLSYNGCKIEKVS